jgi:DNA-binding MarR family transcriptional regulator
MAETIKLGDFADDLSFQIHTTWRAVRKRILRGRTRRSIRKIAPGFYSIPALIGLNPGISPQELAKFLFLDASKVSLFLKTLERQAMVERRPSPADRRKVELHLTDAGRDFVVEGQVLRESWSGAVAGVLTEEETQVFLRLLNKLQEGL